jgi:hypothetical protein
VGLKFRMAKEITSGAHAIMLMGRMCDQISVFGITAWGDPEDGGYQVRCEACFALYALGRMCLP